MSLTAHSLTTIPKEGMDVDITSPLNNQTFECRIFKLGEYYMVATRASYEELQARHKAHHEAQMARMLRGGGVPTVDPQFPQHERIVQYLRSFDGTLVHEKRRLLDIIANGQFTFSPTKVL